MAFMRNLFFSFKLVFFLLFFCVKRCYTEDPKPVGNVVTLIEETMSRPDQEEESFKHLGDHIIAEFTGCINLNNSEELESVLREAAEAAGATILSVTVHKFEPFGMTGVCVLEESHASVHTWPEYGYVSIDVYTCGVHVHIKKALEVLKQFFKPKKVRAVSIYRGFEEKEYDPSAIDQEYRT